jgi:hypothetical protein
MFGPNFSSKALGDPSGRGFLRHHISHQKGLKECQMSQVNEIFEKHYTDYLKRMTALNMEAIAPILGLELDGDRWQLPFFNTMYWVSEDGLETSQGERPDYIVTVVLAQYLLRCPSQSHHDPEWVSFKDFKLTSHFTNQNFFASDTERAIAAHFANKLKALKNACTTVGGYPEAVSVACDLAVRFDALPHLSLLLLFSDSDDEFPASCTVLFQKHAELYLDPESLAVCGAHLARLLKKTSA